MPHLEPFLFFRIRGVTFLVFSPLHQLIFKHDCSRVVQTCMKYCSAEKRAQIALELKGNYLSLSKNTYSRFLVMKVFKFRFVGP